MRVNILVELFLLLNMRIFQWMIGTTGKVKFITMIFTLVNQLKKDMACTNNQILKVLQSNDVVDEGVSNMVINIDKKLEIILD